ncbi:MAG: GNAT family N-acetyltransferase [Phycisphaeraceae bacterium]|nr:GNAT family N-acetyltransferase [Phycisphaeraceae bacterium]
MTTILRESGVEGLVVNISVRTYRPADQPAVSRLYTEGLLTGQIAPNDTGADIENIQDAYFSEKGNHFWVADDGQQVVGMIGVAADLQHSAEIRRLRVDPSLQDTHIAARLVEKAIDHCRQQGFLKVVFDTRFDQEHIRDFFDRFGFQHTRTKSIHGKDLLEFYLDLYRQKKQEDKPQKK